MDGVICELYGENAIFQEIENAKRSDSIQAEWYNKREDAEKKFVHKRWMDSAENMRFEYTDGRNPNFIKLCHELDEFLNELVGGEENRLEYIPYNQAYEKWR